MTSICTLVMTSGSATRHLTLSYRAVSGLLKSSFDLLRSSTDKPFVRNRFPRHNEFSTHRSLLATSCGLDLKCNKCSLNLTGIIAKKGRNLLIFYVNKYIFYDTICPYILKQAADNVFVLRSEHNRRCKYKECQKKKVHPKDSDGLFLWHNIAIFMDCFWNTSKVQTCLEPRHHL